MTDNKKLDIIKSFEAVATGNVADAMNRLEMPSGVIDGLSPLVMGQPRVCGSAVTIEQGIKKGLQKGVVKQRQVITTMTVPGDTVVIDAKGCMSVATAGGLLALSAKMRGVKGFVINGCLRDLEDIASMDFPVHILGGSPAASGNMLETIGINIPIYLGNVKICPGDLILQDSTGCVAIPMESAERVLSVAQVIALQEKVCEELLKQDWEFSEARAKGIEMYPLEI